MSRYVRDWEWGTKYPNFRKNEFICPNCKSYGNGIASSLLDVLQDLRDKYGNLIITSGYRCNNWNKRVGGATNSWHLTGQASDFYFGSGILQNQNKRINVVNEIKKMKNVHYTYCNVNGNHPNMGTAIHVDCYLVDTDVVELQSVLNGQYNCNLAIDGSFGDLTAYACNKNYLFKGKNAPIHITWLQKQLAWRGYDLGKYGIDGQFGNDTQKALKQFQKDHNIESDGLCGKITSKALVFE